MQRRPDVVGYFLDMPILSGYISTRLRGVLIPLPLEPTQ